MAWFRSCAFAAALALSGCAAVGTQPVDLIVTNARVTTLDARASEAQALAVRDGRIVALGSAESVARLAGALTRTVDAGGRRVFPGLIDSHIHAIRAALSYAT